MSDLKAKMHQIQFRLGLRPRPRLGNGPPDPLARFRGWYRESGGEWEGESGEGRELGIPRVGSYPMSEILKNTLIV